MPTDIRLKSTPRRLRDTLDCALVAATRGLMVASVALAILIVIELQVRRPGSDIPLEVQAVAMTLS
jgi:hypothetical protein